MASSSLIQPISGLMKLTLGDSFFDYLAKTLKDALILNTQKDNPNKNIEIEFRIGKPVKKHRNYDDEKWEFDSSVSSEIFNSVKQQLDMNIVPIKTISSVEIKRCATSYGSIRKIKPVVSDIYVKEEYQKKTSINNVDSWFISQPLGSLMFTPNLYMMRFSIASEEGDQNDVLKQEFDKITDEPLVRIRERYSYVFDGYTIDLTIVDYKQYEIELEFSQQLLKSIDFNKLKDISSKSQGQIYLFSQIFFPPVKQLLHFIFPDLKEVRGFDNKSFTDIYSSLLKISYGDSFKVEPKPKNISKKEVTILNNTGYSFTNKLNGVKYRLVIIPITIGNYKDFMAMVLVNNTEIKLVVVDPKILGIANDKLQSFLLNNNGTMADVELFVNGNIGEMHIFDCLVWKKRNVTNYSHSNRLDFLRKTNFTAVSIGNYWNLQIKKFVGPSGNPSKDLQDIYDYMVYKYGEIKFRKDNDGIIMTPEENAYYSRNNWTYKWKFPETVSIDFYIKEIDKISKVQGLSGKEKYTVYEVQVSEITGRGKPSKLVKFDSFTYEGQYYNPPSVYLHPENSNIKLRTGQIIEFTFDRKSNSYVLHTIRSDKVFPNTLNVARDTFIDMKDEFSLELFKTLLKRDDKRDQKIDDKIDQKTEEKTSLSTDTRDLKNYRNYHNRIKEALINKTLGKQKSIYILDLGAGKGGDLFKYQSIKFDFLWAVEPNKSYITDSEGFNERITKLNPLYQRRILSINTGAEKTKEITDIMIDSQLKGKSSKSLATCVTSFFSFSFFFENMNKLQSVVDTISNSLSPEGLFIGTTIDGQRVYEKLQKNNGKITTNIFSIERKYPEDQILGIGNTIEIDLGTPTVPEKQTEWLVAFDILQAKLSEKGIILLESLYLDDDKISRILPLKFKGKFGNDLDTIYSTLSESEKELNSFYRYFIFQKRKTEIPKAIIEARKKLEEERKKNSLEDLNIDLAEKDKYIKSWNQELFRTGVLGGGSCFYHCLLYLMLQSEYLELDNNSREQEAAKLRKTLSNNLTMEQLSKLADGRVEFASFSMFARIELEKYLITNRSEPLITKNKLDEIINSSTSQPNVTEQINFIVSTFKTLQFNDKEKILEVLNEARLNVLLDFKNNIARYSVFTLHTTIEYIMTALEINIFIITDSNRMPVKFCDPKLYSSEKLNIIIMNLEGLTGLSSPHYEPLSEYFIDNENNITQTTLYDWDHPLIQNLYTTLLAN